MGIGCHCTSKGSPVFGLTLKGHLGTSVEKQICLERRSKLVILFL